MKVGLVYNLKRKATEGEPHDKYAEFDDESTVNAIKKALEKGGHEVVMLEAGHDFFARVSSEKPEFVFNIAEGLYSPARESFVPIILEMLEIPYTGSDSVTLALTLDKRRTSEVLKYYGVPVPKHWVCYSAENLPRPKYPVIVKPNNEGSSKGVRNNSLARNRKELSAAVSFVIEEYRQPALVQEYLPGREFTVSLIGNNPVKILPIVEIKFDYLPEGINPIDSYEVKWIWDNPNNPIDPVKCPAKVDEKLETRIKEVAVSAYHALGCRDLCRMDIRLDSKGIPKIIDVNALPGLIPDPKENSRFPKAAYASGYTYDSLINEILEHAVKRTRKNR